MAERRHNWVEGWRLVSLLALVLAGLSLWIGAMQQFEVEGVRMVVRFTARSSLLLFCLAFATSSLARLWPAAGTHWLRRNRRYIGVSFAISHGIHAVAIICFAVMAPPLFMEATSPASLIFGSIGYAFIIAMTITSFDRTATILGPRAWRILHTSGIYYLWVQFMISFGMRVPQMPNYVWFLLPLLAVMTLRIAATLQSRRLRVPNDTAAASRTSD
ncbi:hypothetical protein [Rhodopseudomonas sp. RCAM05734]|uniref:hypothetical protein n=1 Tax=Rhodopseudomonas sp. RCAM05734 TaxID=3457549 RepID=UPI0040445E29